MTPGVCILLGTHMRVHETLTLPKSYHYLNQTCKFQYDYKMQCAYHFQSATSVIGVVAQIQLLCYWSFAAVKGQNNYNGGSSAIVISL